MTKDEQVYGLLMNICPEAVKPIAEYMLLPAIGQMEEDKKDELLARLVELKDSDEKSQALMLIEFAKSMGADPSMFAMDMPELAEYF